jgi:hypothetical protein
MMLGTVNCRPSTTFVSGETQACPYISGPWPGYWLITQSAVIIFNGRKRIDFRWSLGKYRPYFGDVYTHIYRGIKYILGQVSETDIHVSFHFLKLCRAKTYFMLHLVSRPKYLPYLLRLSYFSYVPFVQNFPFSKTVASYQYDCTKVRSNKKLIWWRVQITKFFLMWTISILLLGSFTSAYSSETCSIYVLLLGRESKFHTHKDKLYFYIR